MLDDARKAAFACEAGRRSCLVEVLGTICLNMAMKTGPKTRDGDEKWSQEGRGDDHKLELARLVDVHWLTRHKVHRSCFRPTAGQNSQTTFSGLYRPPPPTHPCLILSTINHQPHLSNAVHRLGLDRRLIMDMNGSMVFAQSLRPVYSYLLKPLPLRAPRYLPRRPAYRLPPAPCRPRK